MRQRPPARVSTAFASGALAVLILASRPGYAGPKAAPTPLPPSSASQAIKPAAERSVAPTAAVGPTGHGAVRGAGRDGQPATPAIRGPKIPENLRKQLQARLDARVDADVAQTKALRGEAIDLLSTFVGETPREAREMPEALVRLGELQWENAREMFVARFQDWDKKPVDQRGPAPELDYRTSRDLFARVLRDYPWFEQNDLALYVDGFLAYEQGKEDEALGPLRAYPPRLPAQSLRLRRPHGEGGGALQRQVRLRGRARRVREGPVVQGSDRRRALRTRALQERLVLLAPRQQRRGGAAASSASSR